MIIERVIQEISPLQRLEKAVTETEAKAADWRRSIAAIETQLNDANLVLMRAQKYRESHAMAARLGDATAVAAIKHARSETHTAEQDLLDLRIALPAAQAQLANAEKAAASARHAVAKVIAEQKMRARVEVAGRIDSIIADFTRLFNEYEKLGNEIVNMDVMPRNSFSMVNYEGAKGERRVAAALPAFVQKLFPGSLHDEMKKEPLATSEARHWNLPPIESDEKAA